MLFNWIGSRNKYQWAVIGVVILTFFIFPKWGALLMAAGSWYHIGLRMKEAIGWASVFATWLAFNGYGAIVVAIVAIYFLYIKGVTLEAN